LKGALKEVRTVTVDKPVFSKEQMISATEISRNFKTVRQKAKKAPLAILERNGLSSVLLNYDQYEKIYTYIRELEEEIVELKALQSLAEIEKDPSCAIPWRDICRDD
jgi:PHD/YefM family antitoxin component YafN of YafNO toxin-antitoxin module